MFLSFYIDNIFYSFNSFGVLNSHSIFNLCTKTLLMHNRQFALLVSKFLDFMGVCVGIFSIVIVLLNFYSVKLSLYHYEKEMEQE